MDWRGDSAYHHRANSDNIRQATPDSGLVFPVKALKMFSGVFSLLESGRVRPHVLLDAHLSLFPSLLSPSPSIPVSLPRYISLFLFPPLFRAPLCSLSSTSFSSLSFSSSLPPSPFLSSTELHFLKTVLEFSGAGPRLGLVFSRVQTIYEPLHILVTCPRILI